MKVYVLLDGEDGIERRGYDRPIGIFSSLMRAREVCAEIKRTQRILSGDDGRFEIYEYKLDTGVAREVGS